MQILANMIRATMTNKRRLAIGAAIFATLTLGAQPRSCNDPAFLANKEVVCAAIKHSPHYNGGKLDAAGFKELHKWTRQTNFTLDDLGCI